LIAQKWSLKALHQLIVSSATYRQSSRVRPDLAEIDPRGTPGLPAAKVVHHDPKGWTRAQLAELAPRLLDLQARLYASAKVAEPGAPEPRRRLLLVLQAMDCGGKDGTIKRLSGAMNPLGMRIASFGPPTKEEQAHPFLWRIERALPPGGYVGVFNRSHYEDVLIVRVHGLVPRRTWQARYNKINRFERELVSSGTTLIKVMLHISPEEQRQRLLDRLADPTKYWKFNPADVDEREHWPAYQEAYTDALTRCGTDEAPWYVVPADRKWYRNWAVANLMLAAFADLKLGYPEVPFDIGEQLVRVESDTPGAPRGGEPTGKRKMNNK